jgi:hypothetical protein
MSFSGNLYCAGWDIYTDMVWEVSIKSQFLDIRVSMCL